MAKRNVVFAQLFVRPQKSFLTCLLATGTALACIASLALLTLALPARAGDTHTPQTLSYARIVRLSYVKGDVQIVRADKSSKWEPAAMNMPVEQGFALGTNDGIAEVEFEHGSMLWLAPDSVVQFTELALSDGGRITRMTVSEGIATLQASLSSGDTFEVDTPNFSVTPAKNAEFKIGIRGKSAAVSVLSGKVLVGDHGSTQEVVKGAMFADEGAKSPKTETAKSPKPDEWDHWVDTRLTTERQGATEAMVDTNSPFSYGMADMAEYGSWNYYPGYGYGWQPWGMMAGWAPFMDGNWMFYPTFGWTWISNEPWGWVPYHFGGWDYSPEFGWMWFPGDYGTWTAAPVQWYGVGKHIGWTPRGVRTPHPAAGATPIIVSRSKLGHEGRNEILSASQIASPRMHGLNVHPVNFQPAENGKAVSMSSTGEGVRPVVVPTSASLQSFRAHLAADSGVKININNLHEAATSRMAIRGMPDRGFMPMNAAMAAPRMPGRPPMRATFNPNVGEGRYAADRPGSMPGPMPISPSMSPVNSAAPMSTAHATATAGAAAAGRPR
jgi:hypothetical protein